MEKTIISGKRKTAIAKLRYQQGTGKIYFNGICSDVLPLFHKLALLEPIRIHEHEIGPVKHDFVIKATGGGKESQIQASRLTIARALLYITNSDALKKAFVAYDRNMVVQDARRKEAAKPNDSAPRARRQKSYR